MTPTDETWMTAALEEARQSFHRVPEDLLLIEDGHDGADHGESPAKRDLAKEGR